MVIYLELYANAFGSVAKIPGALAGYAGWW